MKLWNEDTDVNSPTEVMFSGSLNRTRPSTWAPGLMYNTHSCSFWETFQVNAAMLKIHLKLLQLTQDYYTLQNSIIMQRCQLKSTKWRWLDAWPGLSEANSASVHLPCPTTTYICAMETEWTLKISRGTNHHCMGYARFIRDDYTSKVTWTHTHTPTSASTCSCGGGTSANQKNNGILAIW